MKAENVIATLLVLGAGGFIAYRRYKMKHGAVKDILTGFAPRPATEMRSILDQWNAAVPSSNTQPQP